MKQIRKRLTYANVMSSIAVFLVLGGGVAVAAQLAKNSVGTKQLKKNAVKTSKIANNAVNGAKIADGTVTGAEIGDGTVAAAELADGAVTTAKIADNAVTGAKVDEASLGSVPEAAKLGGIGPAGYMKAADVRADGALSNTFVDNFTSSAFTSVLSKAITAPSKGFLFIVGTISAQDDLSLAGENNLSMRLRLDATGVTNNSSYHELSGGAANDSNGNTAAASAVVPVTVGAHTVHLDARESGTGSFLLGRDLSVLFVPNGSGLTIPVP